MTFDVETRLNQESNENLKLWLAMQACYKEVENYIREQMLHQFGLTLPRFDLMAQLAGQKKGVRMGELSARLMVSNGNITTIVHQLEKEGLIERITSVFDRRSTLIKLTSKGSKHYKKASQFYDSCLDEVFAHLSPSNAQKIQKNFNTLKKALTETTRTA